MNIVITGASGFIGQQLVPILSQNCDQVLLVSRDPAKLKQLFPKEKSISFDQLEIAGKGFDCVLHLSVKNNSQSGDLDQFLEANVELLEFIISAMRTAEIDKLINFSSFHVLDGSKNDNYTLSKRKVDELLRQTSGLEIRNFRLPAVYGSNFAGVLGFLNKLPTFASNLLLSIFGALKPTLNIKTLAVAIVSESKQISGKPGFDEMMLSDCQSGNWPYALFKRSTDIVFCIVIILFFWWLLLIVAVAVKMTSQGPAIFIQERVGHLGKPFRCYKFRTMAQGTKQAGTHEIGADSITPVGNFLRSTKIDELPQIFNILRGELSLVGPRPCLPNQTELIEQRTKKGVLNIVGGITGWSQIQNIDMSDPIKLANTDAEYVVRRTIILDLKILLATMTGKGQGDKTSRK